ncbi:hypothetical protein HBN50_10530 [Halobacteriovorax sp. GB3]|uniref:hypothetical protein n=1 Tax=Halobacteriovorax sp. GB3 TaxID=2719615 RepID=UPI00235E618A|nr:hypothetical protein [Halobacteriovorax sp. GB3]MDD0853537.1 hypothetical protein [Halobacteriovorax sp. GB3]
MKKVVMLLVLMVQVNSFALPTKVGNGDDGSDLSGFVEVKEGVLLETRELALELLKSLNTRGLPLLGHLIDELAHTRIYLTRSNLETARLEELGAFHANSKKLIYARTFPRAYAATRFFPISLSLKKEQLIALHIHEALHRSLPKEIRENEQIVSEITIELTDPKANHDQLYTYLKGVHFDEQEGRVSKNLILEYSLDALLNNRYAENNHDFSHEFQVTLRPSSFLDQYTVEAMGGLEILNKNSEVEISRLLIGGRLVKRSNALRSTFEILHSLSLIDRNKALHPILGRDETKFLFHFSGIKNSFYGENQLSYTLAHNTGQEDIDNELSLSGKVYYLYQMNFSFGIKGEISTRLAEQARKSLISLGPSIRYNSKLGLFKVAFVKVLSSMSEYDHYYFRKRSSDRLELNYVKEF